MRLSQGVLIEICSTVPHLLCHMIPDSIQAHCSDRFSKLSIFSWTTVALSARASRTHHLRKDQPLGALGPSLCMRIIVTILDEGLPLLSILSNTQPSPWSLSRPKHSHLPLLSSTVGPSIEGLEHMALGFVVTVLCLSRRTVLHTLHARILSA